MRLQASAGIAIGPILFVLAIIGIIASMMASGGGGSFGSAAVADRVTADIVGQGNLIRAKIHECQLQYEVNQRVPHAGACGTDSYPCSDQTNGSEASTLTCPNDPLDGTDERSLWSGLRVASFPHQTQGFDPWIYFNAGDAGGRCLWTAPTSGKSNAGAVQGLTRAATKFSSQELSYDPTSDSQKFVIFITPPTGAVNSHCDIP